MVRQNAIIVDLDGTLVNNNVRIQMRLLQDPNNPNWEDIISDDQYDLPNEWCLEIVRYFSDNMYKIIFLTGRGDSPKLRKATEEWLLRYVGPGVDYGIIMRPANARNEDDAMLKHKLYMQYIYPHYDVLFAIDDKRAICDMWENIGIKGLHCSNY